MIRSRQPYIQIQSHRDNNRPYASLLAKLLLNEGVGADHLIHPPCPSRKSTANLEFCKERIISFRAAPDKVIEIKKQGLRKSTYALKITTRQQALLINNQISICKNIKSIAFQLLLGNKNQFNPLFPPQILVLPKPVIGTGRALRRAWADDCNRCHFTYTTLQPPPPSPWAASLTRST